MDVSSDSRVFLPTPLQHSEWKEPVDVKIKTVPPTVLLSHCSPYAAYDTHYAWAVSEDRLQDSELQSFPLPRPRSPQTQNSKYGYVAVSIFNFHS